MNSKNGERIISLDLQQFDSAKKVRFGAKQVGRAISAHPELIDTVYSGLDTVAYQAQAQGRQDILQAVGTFNSLLLTEVDGFEWTKIKDQVLSPEQARVLLTNLPNPNTKQKLSGKERLALRVVKGVLSDRFDDPKKPDWRGVIDTAYTFYSAITIPEVDEDLMVKWGGIYFMQYPQIGTYGSLFWRASLISSTKYDRSDREYFRKGNELANSARIVRPTLELTGEEEKEREYGESLNLCMDALLGTILLGLDPMTFEGRKKYKEVLTNRIGVGRQLPINIPVTGDLIELVQDQRRNLDIIRRVKATEKNREEPFIRRVFEYNLGQNTSDIVLDEILQTKYQVTPELQKIYQAFYPGYRARLIEMVYSQQGKKVTPFSMHGVTGYISSPSGTTVDLRKLSDEIRSSSVVRQTAIRGLERNINAAAMYIPFEGSMIYIVRQEFAERSAVDTYLETVIPTDYTRYAIQVLKDNRERKDAGKKVTRIPTTSGDLYPLSENPEWGQVVNRVVVRKVEGGIGFTIQFTDSQRMLSPQEKTITGIVTAKKGLVRVRFAEGTPQIAASQKWILENLVLRLFERSCTPSLTEAEWESTQRNEHPDLFSKDIPAYITHIGVKKADGSPGTHTKYAEGNLQQARADLQLEFPGTSLEEINTWHKETNPTDKRNVTFNKGRDLPEGHPPSRRSLPDILVVPIDTGTQN